MDRQWGSIWRFLSPQEAFRWGRSSTSTLQTLRRHPMYTAPDMAFHTRRLLGEFYFAILSGQGACACHTASSPPPAWEPPDISPLEGLPGACTLCRSPLYRWSLIPADLSQKPSWDIFWDILWLHVGQTRGPQWHPIHAGYANLGPCAPPERPRPDPSAPGENSSSHNLAPSSYLDRLLDILSMTLWSLMEAAPGTGSLSSLDDIAPSSCWPPMAAKLPLWDPVSRHKRLHAGEVPPALWEVGPDHCVRPVARWDLQWRLRILPQLSFLGTLPTATCEALRIWAWPHITAPQWEKLWNQLSTGGLSPTSCP